MRRAATSISRAKRSEPIVAASSGRSTFTATSAMVLEVLGEIHRGHAALAQLPLNAVAVSEGGRIVEGRWSIVDGRWMPWPTCRQPVRSMLRFHSRLQFLEPVLDIHHIGGVSVVRSRIITKCLSSGATSYCCRFLAER